MRDILIGPGPDGDYGRRRAREEAERRCRLGLCQNCGHDPNDHPAVKTPSGVARMCPTVFYLAPDEPEP